MKEYVASIVAVSILAAIASFVSYGGASERAVKGAVSVILIYTVCMPVADMIGNFSINDFEFEWHSDDTVISSEYLNVSEDAFAVGIKKYVCEEFKLNETEVHVQIYGFDFEKMRAERIALTLSGRAVLSDVVRIERSVENSGLGECEVKIKID